MSLMRFSQTFNAQCLLLLVLFVSADAKKYRKYASGPGCQRWVHTSDCRPDGVREAHNDKACDVEISSNNSGYCLCDDGRKAGASYCGHSTFNCSNKCASLPELISGLCLYFVPTKDCQEHGQRDWNQETIACDHDVPVNKSGYCLCKNERIVRSVGCGHPNFNCQDECHKAFGSAISDDECAVHEELITNQYIPPQDSSKAEALADAQREKVTALMHKKKAEEDAAAAKLAAEEQARRSALAQKAKEDAIASAAEAERVAAEAKALADKEEEEHLKTQALANIRATAESLKKEMTESPPTPPEVKG